MTTTELDRLRAIVGREHVLGEGLAREWAIEGEVPEAVAEPGSEEEVASLVRLAAEHGWAVSVWGGGTQLALGAPPERYQLALSTLRMHRVVAYEPDDMTLTTQPGVTLDMLARTLGERGQFLPLDPPLPNRATAGGTVAAAASGPLRAGYGTPRDWLIGTTVVDAAGERVRPGGRVVKNVAGYDLCKLYTGSLGTLGILTELTFKVLPRPHAWAYSGVSLPDAAAAEELVAGIQDSDTGPAALELVNGAAWEAAAGAALGADRFLLFAVFAGEEEGVAWQQAALEEQAAALGRRAYPIAPLHAEVWARALRDYPARPGLVIRLAALSSEAAALCGRLEALAGEWSTPVVIIAHAANGIVWAHFPAPPAGRVPELVEAVRAEALARSGSAVVTRLPEGAPRAVDRWGPLPAAFPLMRGIKEALDPQRLLNPGRFVGRL
jgi:glycolate oxidase FAD binding subunit